jgi:protein-tyrosine-phosphatase
MKVLVVTETDACCGPMAAAFLRDYSTRIEAFSAGRKPARTMAPLVVVAMRECLIEMENYQPCDLATLDVSTFDAVYECPDLPAPKTIEEFRGLRDYIKNEAFLFFKNHL